jgi:hypothetical protein
MTIGLKRRLRSSMQTSHLVCGTIIERCWRREVNSAKQVYESLKALENDHPIE